MQKYLNKKVDLKLLVPVMAEQINSGKKVSFVPQGNSMLPMLHGGEDTVFLEKPKGRLKKFDVALYYRSETDRYVIHRVVDFQDDGCYVMLGDNNFQREYNIRPQDIVGIVTSFKSRGKMHSVYDFSYKLYYRFWYCFRPVRLLFVKVKNKIK